MAVERVNDDADGPGLFAGKVVDRKSFLFWHAFFWLGQFSRFA